MILRTGFFFCIMLFAAGCGTTPNSRFYLLDSIGNANQDGTVAYSAKQLHIHIGRITLPEYLKHSGIVLRKSGAELKLSELHRWAEPLEENLARVLAENLSILLKTGYVSIYPRRSSLRPDYEIKTSIVRFDADENGEVTLVAYWEVIDSRTDAVLFTDKSAIAKYARDDSYSGIVMAHSEAVSNLSLEMSQAIEGLRQPLRRE